MAIYAYKCSHCDYAADVMQKMSDAELTVCPQCGQSTFNKQMSAAGFQLKGNGYYATDFKQTPAKAAATQAPASTTTCETSACPACV